MLCRADVVKMADHPTGLDLSQQQAVLVTCSTQVRSFQVLQETLLIA